MAKIFNNKRMKERRQQLRNQMPKPEVLLWKEIKGSQIGLKFRRQHSIGAFVVDFYCPTAKLVIEIDGDSHFTPGAIVYDEDRQQQIESLGIKVLRFTNEQISRNLHAVIETIRRSILPPLTPPPGGGDGNNLPLSEGEVEGV